MYVYVCMYVCIWAAMQSCILLCLYAHVCIQAVRKWVYNQLLLRIGLTWSTLLSKQNLCMYVCTYVCMLAYWSEVIRITICYLTNISYELYWRERLARLGWTVRWWVVLTLSFAVRSAPWSSSSFATASWPLHAAQISAVLPSYERQHNLVTSHRRSSWKLPISCLTPLADIGVLTTNTYKRYRNA